MTSCKIIAAAVLGAGLCAVSASADARPAAQCFWGSQAQSFAPMDRSAVNVRTTSGDVYQFQMAGKCPDIDWRRDIAIQSRGSEKVCADRAAEIVTRTSLGPLHCAVRQMRKLTPAEVAALPDDARPR